MKEAVLIVHIATALMGIIAGLVGSMSSRHIRVFAQRAFWPLTGAITISGVGLAAVGGSITHACISGVSTLSVLAVLRYFSAQRSITQGMQTKDI